MGKDNLTDAVRIVADCGATSTSWAISGPDGCMHTAVTSGMNATLMSPDEIAACIGREIPDRIRMARVEEVHFYAAGCRTDAQREAIAAAVGAALGCTRVEVDSDMLGAARALCGRADGIAAIIGTGSNCSLYKAADGGRIAAAVSPGGFILGDEGSGAHIGRTLASDFIKGIMPEQLRREFAEEFGPADEIIRRTYRCPAPNAFLASMARFAGRHSALPYIDRLLAGCFDAFLSRNVARLPGCHELPVGFTGGVAAAFAPQLKQALSRAGMRPGRITPSPLTDLANFHNITP